MSFFIGCSLFSNLTALFTIKSGFVLSQRAENLYNSLFANI
ncbi:hypothetical protein CF65_00925 [Aggregatibacter actinomycetemcomitans HK1651]|nr:hypothetical protein CF65_00925 [Aggregatibacter actinomycetemcomitans HK1651]